MKRVAGIVFGVCAGMALARPGWAASPRAIMLDVQGDASGRCDVVFKGRSYGLGPSLEQAIKADRFHRSEIHIIADVTTPWRCVGGVMAWAQRAGFKKVGFIAEPPPGGNETK